MHLSDNRKLHRGHYRGFGFTDDLEPKNQSGQMPGDVATSQASGAEGAPFDPTGLITKGLDIVGKLIPGSGSGSGQQNYAPPKQESSILPIVIGGGALAIVAAMLFRR